MLTATINQARRRRGRWIWRTTAFVVALSMLTACSGGDSAQSQSPAGGSGEVPAAKSGLPEVTWALEAEPTTLDPIYDYAYYDNTVISNMCEPLVKMNADLSTSDWLATSKMVDPLTWTYDLKPDVTFWDGSPLTPEDVVYSFKRNLDPQVGSYFESYFRRVDDVVQTGPTQVTVKLSKPDALWNTSTILTAGAYIVSKKFAEQHADKFGTPGVGVMCTGPYKFGSWTPGDSITMNKNENYWNHDAAAKTDTVKFVFLPDSSAQSNALTSQQAQGMYLRDLNLIPRLEGSGNIYMGDGLTYQFLSPTEKKGPLNDVRIRQALSKAIDRQAIATSIFEGAATPLKTLVGKDAWGPDPAVIAVYQKAYDSYPDLTQDTEGAKRLVQEAGSPTEPIVLGYATDGGEYQVKLASVVQDEARKIGLNVELKQFSPTEAAALYVDPAGLAAAGVDMLMVSYNVNNADPFGMYQTYDPEAGIVDNYSHFFDDAASASLEEAAGTYDDVKRAELTVAAEQVLMKSMPLIPVVSINTVLYLQDGVTGPPASFSQIWSAWASELGSAE